MIHDAEEIHAEPEAAADLQSRLTDAVGARIETVKGTLGNMMGNVGPTEVRAAAARGAGIAAENPLGLALGALAVGFLAGLLVPVTEYERETVGPIRDDLLDRAQNAGSDALEHGKAVLAETAQAALQTAQQSAQRHAQQLSSEAVMGDHMSNGNSTPTNSHGDTAENANADYGVIIDERDDAPEPGTPPTGSL